MKNEEVFTVRSYDLASGYSEGENLTVSSTDAAGDYVLANKFPQLEYMYGCSATSLGMLLAYYDLYGYTINGVTYSYSNLIDGTISVNSRGSDGGSIYDMKDPSNLAKFVASTGYVSRFYDKTKEEELPYTFVDGDPSKGLNVSAWDSLADYLGTGQYWRGNGDLSTKNYFNSLNEVSKSNQTNTIGGYTIPIKYEDFRYGLSLYVESKGYSLDGDATCSYEIEDFSFEEFKAEIDAGRPVLLSMKAGSYGHMVVAYGYNESTKEVIFDDTYHADCRMEWDGTYNYSGSNYSLNGVTTIVFNSSGEEGGGEGEGGQLTWYTDYNEALAKAKELNVPVLVYYGDSSRCGYCKRLEEDVFSSEEFRQYADSSVVLLKNPSSAPGLSHSSIPACFILDSQGKSLGTKSGYGDKSSWMNWFTETITLAAPEKDSVDLLAKNIILADNVKATVSTGEIYEKKPLYLSFDVVNEGTIATTGSFTVTVKMDDKIISEKVISPPLKVGDTYKISDLSLGSVSAGTHSLSIIVDSKQAIKESNEENNTVTSAFTAVEEDAYKKVTTHLNIGKNTASSYLRVNEGGVLTIEGGGFAENVIVSPGGGLYVSALGGISLLTVQNGAASAVVEGVCGNANVFGVLEAEGSGRLSNMTVTGGGVVTVSENASGDGFSVSDAGNVFVSSGGKVSNIQVKNGGTASVSSGGTVTDAIVSSNGSLIAQSSGVLSSLKVLRGGQVSLQSGSLLTGKVNIANGGKVTAENGASVVFDVTSLSASSSALVNNLSQISGNAGYSVTVSADQAPGQYILAGGAENFDSVISVCAPEGTCLGSVTVGGSVSSAERSYQVSLDQGVLSLNVTSGGGIVSSGGGIVSSGGGIVSSGGGIVSSGGGIVSSGGGIVSSGGTIVSSAGFVDPGMNLHVASGEKVVDMTINSGGNIILSSGGAAMGTVINSKGGLHVYSGAGASGTVVKQHGFFGVGLGATTYDTTIDYAGELTVWGGGKVVDNTINQWGAIILSSGAAAENTLINTQGGLHVYSGAVASNTVVKQNGFFGVGLGATTYDTTIDYAGELTVWGGGIVHDNEINQWGAIILLDGAIANRTVINPDGGLHIYNGATAYTTEVTSGARLGIGLGGYLFNSELENTGLMTFYDGARMAGWHNLEGTVITSGKVDARNAYIHFELDDRSSDQGAILDNMENLGSVLRYSAEVGTDQEEGTYILAGGAGDFREGLTLYVGEGNDCGTLFAGEIFEYGGKRYSLENEQGLLALKIS